MSQEEKENNLSSKEDNNHKKNKFIDILEIMAKSYAGAKVIEICHATGLTTVRTLRKGNRVFLKLVKKSKIIKDSFLQQVIKNAKIFATKNGIYLSEHSEQIANIKSDFSKSWEKGIKEFAKHTARQLGYFTVNLAKKFITSPNYVAPLVATICFCAVISTALSLTYALEVSYDGQMIGYIEDESVFLNAEQEVLKRIVFEDYIKPENAKPVFSIKVVKESQISNENSLTNEIIKASGHELSEATGLYIDERFMGAIEDANELEDLLIGIKDSYKTGAKDETTEFVKYVEMVDGLYPVTSVVDVRELDKDLQKEESQQRIYITVSGDSPTLIADKNGVPYAQLKALNPTIEKELFIGQEVLVEKAVPTLEVQLTRLEVVEKEIPFAIERIQDSSKYQGYVDVSQEGKEGLEEITSEVTYIDEIETSRMVLDTRTIKEPINEKMVVGGMLPTSTIPTSTKPSTSTKSTTTKGTSDYFMWPLPGGKVTAAFGSAGYYGHTGLDIGRVATGSPVVASAAGTVTAVKYNSTGYGYHIMIDHGGGVQTLYAHNSKMYVQVGDWVEQGDVIAGVGRTGNATGVHVHLEIRVGGKYMNPSHYF